MSKNYAQKSFLSLPLQIKFGIDLSTEKVHFSDVCKNETEILSNNFQEIPEFTFLCQTSSLVGKLFSHQHIFSEDLTKQKSIDIICENTPHNYDPYRGMQRNA